MDDFERVCQEVNYKLQQGQIYSYWIQVDFSKHMRMIEVVDNKGNVKWNYFDKRTGLALEKAK